MDNADLESKMKELMAELAALTKKMSQSQKYNPRRLIKDFIE
jgi:ribosomal protein L29